MLRRKTVDSRKLNIGIFIIVYLLYCVLFLCFSCNVVNAANVHNTADNSNSAPVIAEGTSGGVTWQINEEGLLKLFATNHVSGTMDSFADNADSAPWHQYRTEIKSVKIEKGVAAGNSVCWMFYGCNKMISADVAELDVSNTQNMKAIFSGCSSLEYIKISGWDTSSVNNMSSAFQNCSAITELSIGDWDTHEVTYTSYMFQNCRSLKSIDISAWNTAKVVNMGYMFSGCSSLTEMNLRDLDVSNVTNLSYVFQNCTQLCKLDISKWNTEKVLNMYCTFQNCKSLTYLDIGNWNTCNVKKMYGMFSGCSSLVRLDIGNWNVSSLNDMGYIFQNCSSLINLDIGNWNVSNVTNMSSAFQLCSKLTCLDIGNWNTQQVTNMNRMFYHCDSLKIFNAGRWNTKKVTNAEYMFRNCNALNQLCLSSNITSKIREQLPSRTWMHIQFLDGTKTHDYTGYTTSQLADLSLSDVNGIWKIKYDSDSVKNPDGTYEYVTDDDLWIKNGNTWTYTFDVFNDSVPFYFWEENLPGFSSDMMPGTDGLFNKVGTTGETRIGTVTNKQDLDSGNLKISKTVAGSRTNAKFKFIITLTGDHIKDTCEYSDVVFTKRAGIVYLKDGESKTISGIPAGTTYSVAEEQTRLYQSQGENASGIIEKDQTKEAAFTNTEIKDDQPSKDTEVNVTVAKKVLPENNKENEKYQMTASLTGLNQNTSYALSDGTEFISDSNGNGYVEFSLAQNEEIIFLHLPVGCTYQITEAAGDYISSYEVTDDRGAGMIAKNEYGNTKENQELSTGKETAEAGENVKVTFTNEIQYLQNLILTKKTVRSNGRDYDSKESFSFTITFSNLKPGQSFASTVGKVKADEDGTAEKTITLKNGEKAEFYKIPYGTEYQIKEEKNEYEPSYRIDAATVVKATDKAPTNTDLSTETEIIDMGEDNTVTFTNGYPEHFSLPNAGSHTLELLAGAAIFALVLGHTSRKQLLCKKRNKHRNHQG